MDVLPFKYLLPFHHLSLVSLEAVEFPSYNSRSVRAQTLEGEADKILQKGVLELVENRNPGYYCWLFLVQKASRGCWCV